MKTETLCKLRDLYRTLAACERQLEEQHGLCLNEGMLLCTLSKQGRLTSGALAAALGLTYSNCSKVLRSVERKGYVKRDTGETDRRQMCFTLTPEGRNALQQMCTAPLQLPAPLETVLAAL